MAVSLEMSDNFVLPVCTNRHVLPANSAVELAQFICSNTGPGDKKLSQFPNSVSLLHFEGASGSHPPTRLFHISVLPTGICRVTHTMLLLWRHGRPLIEFAEHLIKLCKQKTNHETTEIRSHTEQFRSTNWSSTDPGPDSSPPQLLNGRETPADALSLGSPMMKDLQSTDLKQENMERKHGANEE